MGRNYTIYSIDKKEFIELGKQFPDRDETIESMDLLKSLARFLEEHQNERLMFFTQDGISDIIEYTSDFYKDELKKLNNNNYLTGQALYEKEYEYLYENIKELGYTEGQ